MDKFQFPNNKISIIGIIYSIVAICFTLYISDDLYSQDNSITTESNLDSSKIPTLSSKNMSYVIQKRLQEIQSSFETVLKIPRAKWTNLKHIKSSNLTFEFLEAKGEFHYYIRTRILIKAPPQNVYRSFNWQNLHATLTTIDPFYESTELLHKLSSSNLLLRKVN